MFKRGGDTLQTFLDVWVYSGVPVALRAHAALRGKILRVGMAGVLRRTLTVGGAAFCRCGLIPDARLKRTPLLPGVASLAFSQQTSFLCMTFSLLFLFSHVCSLDRPGLRWFTYHFTPFLPPVLYLPSYGSAAPAALYFWDCALGRLRFMHMNIDVPSIGGRAEVDVSCTPY